ncbi:unnamed protein product [Symbiodinium microadriaticum]|nr:unnamed protein product [Symbiodinium microadriaticum]
MDSTLVFQDLGCLRSSVGMFPKTYVISFVTMAMVCLTSAGLDSVRSRAEIGDLERAVAGSVKPHLIEDVTDIKYLLEKVDSLRTEGKGAEADALQRRVDSKIETLKQDLSSEVGDLDRESPDRNSREGMANRLRERSNRYREKMSGFGRDDVLPEHMDIPDHADLHEEMMKRHRERDAQHGHKDIADRHKELIEHRQRDITERIERAGFSPEEESRLKKNLEDYLAIEKEVMESRTRDKTRSRDRREKKTAEQRMQERDGMKKRRDYERSRMEVAREMRKNIDSAIREKIAGQREF